MLSRRKLLGSAAGLLAYGSAGRVLSQARVVPLTAYGPAPGDGSDISGTISTALKSIAAGGGNVTLLVGPGGFRTSYPLAVSGPNVVIQGVRGQTCFIPMFQGSVFSLGGDPSAPATNCGLVDINLAAGVTQTAGSAVTFGAGSTNFVERMLCQGFYDGVWYGSDANGFASTGLGILKEFHGGFAHDGVVMSSQTSLTFEGLCRISSNNQYNGAGLKFTGAMDGVFTDGLLVVDGFFRALRVCHNRANVANVRLKGGYSGFGGYGFDLNPSGSGGINGFTLEDADLSATPAASGGVADVIRVANTGTGAIQGLRVRARVYDAPQRVVKATVGVISDASFEIQSVRGGAKSPGSYPGMDFGQLAHRDVTIANTELAGQHSWGVQGVRNVILFKNYGLYAPGAYYGDLAP
jgi:hypothetical protein